MKNNYKSLTNKYLGQKKQSRKKAIGYMSNGKVMIVQSIAGLIKKTKCNSIDCIKMSQYSPKPYGPFGGDINIKDDLSNYPTKTDIKNILHIDASSLH